MRTKILPEAALDAIKRRPRLYGPLRQGREFVGAIVPPRSLPGVPGRVHTNDFMCDGTSSDAAASYAVRGREDAETVERLVAAVGVEPGTWLDFGCGYGRVTRWIAGCRRPGSITCYDVNWEAARFCADELGVNAVRASAALEDLRLGRFDAVFSISVVTHLADDRAFLRSLPEHVAPGGVLVFTTQGEWSARHARQYGPFYDPARIGADLAASGTSWVPYPHGDGRLGMRWHTREYVERHTPLEIVAFEPQGLGGHQDVFAFARPA